MKLTEAVIRGAHKALIVKIVIFGQTLEIAGPAVWVFVTLLAVHKYWA
jgi:hypothetical protein